MKWLALFAFVLVVPGCTAKSETGHEQVEKNTTLPPVQIDGSIKFSIKG